jgi:hypothetical protein
MMSKPFTNKLAPTCGAQYFRWRLSVEENMGVGCGVWSWPIVGTIRVGGEKCPSYAWSRGFGKVYGWDPTFIWRVGGW